MSQSHEGFRGSIAELLGFNSAGGRSWWNAYSWEIDMKALSHDLVRYPYRDPGVTRYY